MPDLIFAGAASKKALNFAEVTITFAEVKGYLPLDFEEVAVTRRLHRSGESEYWINGQPVRLKDIQSLFLDSGVGKNNMSFFEQGKIDQLIQYSPEERRYIFEEAAGIVRFLQRKRETFRKLEEVDLNLSRAADISKEVERQVLVLEEQAEAASVYKGKKEQLEFLEKELLEYRYKAYLKKQEDLIGKESLAKENLRGLAEKRQNGILQEKQKAYEALERNYRSAREQLISKQSEKELKLQTKKHSEERARDLATREEKLSLETSSLKKQLATWTLEMGVLEQSKGQLDRDLKKASEAYLSAEEKFQILDKELQLLRKKQTEAYRSKMSAFQTQSALQNEVKQLIYRMETNLSKKDLLEERSRNLNLLLQEKQEALEQARSAYELIETAFREGKEALQEMEGALKKGGADVQEAKRKLDEMLKKVNERSAKLNALLSLRQEFAGFSSGGKKLLQAAQDPKSPIFSLLKGLYEVVHLKKEYEKVFKRYAETLVVPKAKDLDKILAFAKEHRLFDISLICLESIPDPENHLLEGVVLKEGYFIDSKGVIFIPGENDSSVFRREGEIKALKIEIEELLKENQALETELELFQKIERDLITKKKEKEEEVRSKERGVLDAKYGVQKHQAELERTTKERSQVDEEVAGLVAYVQNVILEREKVSSAYEKASSGLDQLESALLSLEKEIQDKNLSSVSQKEDLKQKESLKSRCEGDYRKASHQYHVLDAKIEETKRLCIRLEGELTSVQKTKKEIFSLSEDHQTGLAALEEELKVACLKVNALEKMLDSSKLEWNALQKQDKELESALKEIENKLHQLSISFAHVETGQNALALEMKERFQVEITGEISTSLSQDKVEKEIPILKKYLEQNPNVNLGAIDECVKQKERATFLSEQITDLTAAKEELLKLIAGLDQECRSLFKTTFEQIRANFKKNFQILFKGGEADLELVESEDLLEAGIEITAKPPGKQMRALSLLSGGEKCLTAMALLFAIFEVKSSPFCVLDEIDAPLDDSNVERFLNVVKQFIDRCQFIIVTHNKRTMALADRLYGVSMEEKGISKILFMEFSGNRHIIGV